MSKNSPIISMNLTSKMLRLLVKDLYSERLCLLNTNRVISACKKNEPPLQMIGVAHLIMIKTNYLTSL